MLIRPLHFKLLYTNTREQKSALERYVGLKSWNKIKQTLLYFPVLPMCFVVFWEVLLLVLFVCLVDFGVYGFGVFYGICLFGFLKHFLLFFF